MNLFTIPADNYLRNCSRHIYQKVGLISGYEKGKTNMVKQCVYCGHVQIKDENGR